MFKSLQHNLLCIKNKINTISSGYSSNRKNNCMWHSSFPVQSRVSTLVYILEFFTKKRLKCKPNYKLKKLVTLFIFIIQNIFVYSLRIKVYYIITFFIYIYIAYLVKNTKNFSFSFSILVTNIYLMFIK